MATVTFRDARIFFGGYEITGQMNEAGMSMEVDALDETVFGATSRRFKGGLQTSNMTGKGFYYVNPAVPAAPDPAIYDLMGVSDVPIVIFPEDITLGSTSSGYGYAMLSVETKFSLGGKVGELLMFDFEAKGRGQKP